MKKFTGQISIKTNSSKGFSNSSADFKQIRTNSQIKFGDDDEFYTVKNVEPIFYIKPFAVNLTTLRKRTIEIKETVGFNVLVGDQVTLSFKEFGLAAVMKVITKGKKYKVGEELTVKEGIFSTNMSTGESESPVLRVLKASSSGGVEKVEILNQGKILEPGAKLVTLLGENAGTGCSILIEYKLLDDRKIIERLVDQKQVVGGNTELILNYAVPKGTKAGKLSLKKWAINLTFPYNGETQISSEFELLRDKTPEFGIPLMSRGSQSKEQVFNAAVKQISKKIKVLEDRIEELEKNSIIL